MSDLGTIVKKGYKILQENGIQERLKNEEKIMSDSKEETMREKFEKIDKFITGSECNCGCGTNCCNSIPESSSQQIKISDISKNIALELIKSRKLYGNRMGITDELCNTNLISKNYSPMFIRKFNASQLSNWPLYVSMICDEDVSDIDQVVNGVLIACHQMDMLGNNLQQMRNFTGILSETLSKYYNGKKENCVEGIAITLYIDKAYIQNFTGDYMNHAQCRAEYTAALRMMTQI